MYLSQDWQVQDADKGLTEWWWIGSQLSTGPRPLLSIHCSHCSHRVQTPHPDQSVTSITLVTTCLQHTHRYSPPSQPSARGHLPPELLGKVATVQKPLEVLFSARWRETKILQTICSTKLAYHHTNKNYWYTPSGLQSRSLAPTTGFPTKKRHQDAGKGPFAPSCSSAGFAWIRKCGEPGPRASSPRGL